MESYGFKAVDVTRRLILGTILIVPSFNDIGFPPFPKGHLLKSSRSNWFRVPAWPQCGARLEQASTGIEGFSLLQWALYRTNAIVL